MIAEAVREAVRDAVGQTRALSDLATQLRLTKDLVESHRRQMDARLREHAAELQVDRRARADEVKELQDKIGRAEGRVDALQDVCGRQLVQQLSAVRIIVIIIAKLLIIDYIIIIITACTAGDPELPRWYDCQWAERRHHSQSQRHRCLRYEQAG